MAEVVRYRRFRCFRNLECREEEDFVTSCRCIDVASVKDDMKIVWQYSGICDGT